MKLARWVARSLIFLVSTAILLEVYFRVEDRLLRGIPLLASNATGMDSLFNFDEVGKYGRPHATYRNFHLNGAGFRGPELQDGTYRVLCLGSSETFGQFESAGKEWPRQLQDQLNQSAPAPRYEVISGAYPGITLATILRRLPQTLDTTHPRLAVIYPAGASYARAVRAATWPVDTPLHPKAVPMPFRSRARDRLTSLFARHFAWRYESMVPQHTRDVLARKLGTESATPTPPVPPGAPRIPENQVQFFRTDLEHLIQLLQSRGVSVLLLTHGNIFGDAPRQEDRELLTTWRSYYPAISEEGVLDEERRMRQVVMETGQTMHVPVIDMAELIPRDHQHYADFVHFTDAGANRMAELVAAEIVRERETGELSGAPR